MIKIIKEGTKRVAVCNYCGCQFSYEAEDICHSEIVLGQNTTITGHKPGFKDFVLCPQCCKQYIISQTK